MVVIGLLVPLPIVMLLGQSLTISIFVPQVLTHPAARIIVTLVSPSAVWYISWNFVQFLLKIGLCLGERCDIIGDI